jgi:hypothetical protein
MPRQLALAAATIAAAALALGALALAKSGGGDEPTVATGPAFERVEIAPRAGDVKLVGDLDGDGRVDLVLGGGRESGLIWWRWPDLRPTEIAVPTTEFTTDGALADLDGDGDLDIVIPDGREGVNLLWFENPRPDGDPTDPVRWRRHGIGSVPGWVKDVAIVDFDEDERLDVAVRSARAAAIHFQVAPGVWQKVVLAEFGSGEGMAGGDVDNDGDTDLVLRGSWMANPGHGSARDPSRWTGHEISRFDSAFKAVVADLDGDGRSDIVTSSSENTADVAWFGAPDGPTGKWTRHVIESDVEGAHTLQPADMDLDGDLDLVVGQMHTTDDRELAVHFNVDGNGQRWQRALVDDVGLHNGVVADIDSDGDMDIFGSNWVGNPPLRVWLNRLDPPESVRPINRWTYSSVTSAHVRAFGLAVADVDGDGRNDIVSGPSWYRPPGDGLEGPWVQVRLGEHRDAVAALDLDHDGRAEIVAQDGSGADLGVVLLKASDATATRFDEIPVGVVPRASHELGSQGHVVAQVLPGGSPEIVLSSGGGVFYFATEGDPVRGSWRRVRISGEPSDEGIAVTDVDGDGWLDLVATSGEAMGVAWWRHPRDGTADWQRRVIGAFPDAVFPDRVAAADFSGDGRVDVVATEENGKGNDAEAYLWLQPRSAGESWERRLIARRGTLNSLSVDDLDNDGDADIIAAEHRGARRLSIWNNLGGGHFIEQLVDAGKESHLGARAVDLDADGDLDVLSIAWDAPETIHLWRNDACSVESPCPVPPQLMTGYSQ